jgi:hypothetical protein
VDQRHFWAKSLQAKQPQLMIQKHSMSDPQINQRAYKIPATPQQRNTHKFTQKLHYYTFKNLNLETCISFKFPPLFTLNHHLYTIKKLLYALIPNCNTKTVSPNSPFSSPASRIG